MIIQGKIVNYDGEKLYILAPFNDTDKYIRQKIIDCEIKIFDGRSISADQRKKIYATFADISEYTGHTPEQVKAIMKYLYIRHTGAEYFSLSDADMTTAKDFLQFLIEFCIEQDIPTSDNLIDRAPDIQKYIYACAINKKCCITGKKAELHHEHAIGRGRNRKEIIHEGMSVLPLCREMHIECHTIGQQTFNSKYHVFGVKADKEICRVYKLKEK